MGPIEELNRVKDHPVILDAIDGHEIAVAGHRPFKLFVNRGCDSFGILLFGHVIDSVYRRR